MEREQQIIAMLPEQEKNSKWISYELHDGLLQWVVGARMQLEAMKTESLSPQMQKQLQQSRRMLKLALDEGRHLIRFLGQDESQGAVVFLNLLEQFVEELQGASEHSIEIICAQPAWPDLPEALVWNLLRITQQAVLNSIQHAGPAKITIVTSYVDAKRLSIQVSDDGRGFAYSNPSQPNHFGMSSMKHRADLIGAQLEVDTAPAKGCRIKVTFAV